MIIYPVTFNQVTAAETRMVPHSVTLNNTWNKTGSGYVQSVLDDDDDYIYPKASGGVLDNIGFRMSAVTDPGVDAGFDLVIKHYATDASDFMRIYLLQDGEIISASYYSPSLVLNTWVEETIAIPSADVANITDFSQVELTLNCWTPDVVRVKHFYIDLP